MSQSVIAPADGKNESSVKLVETIQNELETVSEPVP